MYLNNIKCNEIKVFLYEKDYNFDLSVVDDPVHFFQRSSLGDSEVQSKNDSLARTPSINQGTQTLNRDSNGVFTFQEK